MIILAERTWLKLSRLSRKKPKVALVQPELYLEALSTATTNLAAGKTVCPAPEWRERAEPCSQSSLSPDTARPRITALLYKCGPQLHAHA